MRVRHSYLLLSFFMIMLMTATFLGCNETEAENTPVLARGLINVEDNDSFGCKPGCHAYVKIVKISDDSVIAETKLESIQYMPKYYEIRMPYRVAFKDYWSDYAIRCDFYNSKEDNTVDLSCSKSIDISSYDRNIDLDIR